MIDPKPVVLMIKPDMQILARARRWIKAFAGFTALLLLAFIGPYKIYSDQIENYKRIKK
jgi:hypothetical protein